MGNAQVMTAKVVWDFSIYWGVNALIFFHNKSQDLRFWQEMRQILARFDNLNLRMQQFFRDWDAMSEQQQWYPDFVNYMDVQFIHDLHIGLEETLDEATLKTRIHANVELLEAIAEEMFQQAAQNFAAMRDLPSPVEQPQLHDLENGLPMPTAVNGNETAYHATLPPTVATSSATPDFPIYDIKTELDKIWLNMEMSRHIADAIVAT